MNTTAKVMTPPIVRKAITRLMMDKVPLQTINYQILYNFNTYYCCQVTMCILVYKRVKQLLNVDYKFKYFTDTLHNLSAPTYQILKMNGKIKQEWNAIKQVAVRKKACAMSANQISSLNRYFVILTNNKLVDNKWHGYQCEPKHYEIVSNPKIQKSSIQQTEHIQQCQSFPGLIFRMKRPSVVKVSYTNQLQKQVVEQIKGFKSAIWQQHIDTLDGKVLIDYLQCKGNFEIHPSYLNRNIKALNQFSQAKAQFDHYIEVNQEKNKQQLYLQYSKLIQAAKYCVIEPIIKLQKLN